VPEGWFQNACGTAQACKNAHKGVVELKKTIWVSEKTHQQLKTAAAKKGVSMKELLDRLATIMESEGT